nr:MAG TPA: hypothetical protein [Caudoviricetes sp.]
MNLDRLLWVREKRFENLSFPLLFHKTFIQILNTNPYKL